MKEKHVQEINFFGWIKVDVQPVIPHSCRIRLVEINLKIDTKVLGIFEN